MWWWERLIDDKVKAAQEKGLFDNLRGHGKPFPKSDEDESNPEWLANHLLKEAGFLPNWLQLRKEIHAERSAVIAALQNYRRHRAAARPDHRGDQAVAARLEQRYVELARAINRKIDEHNVWCPSISQELVRFQEDAIARERQKASR